MHHHPAASAHLCRGINFGLAVKEEGDAFDVPSGRGFMERGPSGLRGMRKDKYKFIKQFNS